MKELSDDTIPLVIVGRLHTKALADLLSKWPVTRRQLENPTVL